jgi:hypothetical protein
MAEATLSTRTGSHRHQPTGYRAFIPALLLPDPLLHLSQALLSLERLTGTTDPNRHYVPGEL